MSDETQPPADGSGEEERPSPGRSVLPRIEKQLGKRVRVELRAEGEAASEAGEGPLLEGRYRLHGELGRGGVGVVMRGSDLDLGRDVAISPRASGALPRASSARRGERPAPVSRGPAPW
jgi:hypothetical protein